MELEKVKDQIQKLLNLASNKGATEAEASLALAKATELLEKYNLSVDEAKILDSDQDLIAEDWGLVDSHRWRLQLSLTVAEHFMCKVIYITSWDGKNMKVMGRRANVECAITMLQWIVPQMMGEVAGELFRHPSIRGASRNEWKASYLLGMTARINGRLKAMREERHTADTGIHAVVVSRLAEAEAYMHKLFPKTVSLRQNKGFNSAAYGRGFDDGDKISLGSSGHLSANGQSNLLS